MTSVTSKRMYERNNKTERYKYAWSQKLTTYVLLPAMSLVSVSLGFFLIGESIVAGIVLFAIGAWFGLLGAFGSLACSSIAVSDEGIAAYNFGRTLRFIPWRYVIKVKKVRRWNAGSRSYQDDFYIFDSDFSAPRERMVNLRGPISFSDKIRGLRQLLDRINDRARQHRFSLIVLDQEAARNRALQPGAGPWERTVPKVDEMHLMEL